MKTSVLESALLNKSTPAQVFSCKFCENFNNTYSAEHLGTAVSESLLWTRKFRVFDSSSVRVR